MSIRELLFFFSLGVMSFSLLHCSSLEKSFNGISAGSNPSLQAWEMRGTRGKRHYKRPNIHGSSTDLNRKAKTKKLHLFKKKQEETKEVSPPLLSTHPYYMVGKPRRYEMLSAKEAKKRRREKTSAKSFLIKRERKKTKEERNLGSLWSSEGQGAYLFSENNLKQVGDPINVVLNGSPKKQLSEKKKVIKNLLLNKRERQLFYRNSKEKSSLENLKNEDLKALNKEKPNLNSSVSEDILPMDSVATKIVEQLSKERYRVEGCEVFLIEKKQYCLVVMGIVRSQDLLENKIEATRLIDGYFDIVKFKSKQKLLKNIYL